MQNSQVPNQGASVKPGDIFALGDHRLGCGDSRDSEFVTKVLDGARVALILCDPPYGVSVVESKRGFQKLSKDKVIINDHEQSEDEYRVFTKAWLEAASPHLLPKNTAYIFNSDRMVFALRSGMEDAGFKFSQLLIWIKSHAVIGRMDYLPQHELIAYGWHGTHKFMKAKDKSVLVYPKPSKSNLHPTTKPVGLIRRLILNSSKVGDNVYEPFLGSGTCLLACEDTRRRCYAIEIDPEYVATAILRFERKTGVKARKL